MAKPPVSYGSKVKLAAVPAASAGAANPELTLSRPAEAPAGQTPIADMPLVRRRPMESRSDPTVLYLHPEGKYELKRYALARGPKVKVHDLIMEALEEWAERHGISAPFRVPSERPRRQS